MERFISPGAASSVTVDNRLIATLVGLITASTLLVTSSLVGVLALTEGLVGGLGGRVPYYVLSAAIVFVALLVVLEMRLEDGSRIITSSVVVSLVALIAISLSVEGLLFGATYTDRLFSNLLPYFLAAGLISTGLIIWALRHWREFVTQTRIR
mgnify:CR=1 FL=1